MPKPLVVINVVGLTYDMLGANTPNIKRLADEGFARPMGTVLPAVTCSAQSTILTGQLPGEHGIDDLAQCGCIGEIEEGHRVAFVAGQLMKRRAGRVLGRYRDQPVMGNDLCLKTARIEPEVRVRVRVAQHEFAQVLC